MSPKSSIETEFLKSYYERLDEHGKKRKLKFN